MVHYSPWPRWFLLRRPREVMQILPKHILPILDATIEDSRLIKEFVKTKRSSKEYTKDAQLLKRAVLTVPCTVRPLQY